MRRLADRAAEPGGLLFLSRAAQVQDARHPGQTASVSEPCRASGRKALMLEMTRDHHDRSQQARRPAPRRLVALALALALAVAGLTGCAGTSGTSQAESDAARAATPAAATTAAGVRRTATDAGASRRHGRRGHRARRGIRGLSARRPNIVFILADDLSWDLVRYMPHLRRLQRRGATFTRFFTSNSLCCPSRASILTGKFPHNTHIFTNTGPGGGFPGFHGRGEERATFATALQSAGYRTALMGKYLNGYHPAGRLGGPRPYVPPGWSEWDATGAGYPEFGYTLNENGRVVRYGYRARDYLTDVLARKGGRFIRSSARQRRPFMLEIATFSPHAPFTPAPRDSHRFAGLRAPRGPAFDEGDIADKPAWLRKHRPLTRSQIRRMDRAFRLRVRAVQSIDRMIGRLRHRLARRGELDNTYFVFSSDNGMHLGQHRLAAGKLTAFDTDIRVPLVVAGPGITPGTKINRLASNVDFCPTFTDIGQAPTPPSVDGRSLLPLLHGRPVPDWRQAILVEHHRPRRDGFDPDFPQVGSGDPPSYAAIRTADRLYVEYADGEREYYDLAEDPHELFNRASELTPASTTRLAQELDALRTCRGPACARAQREAAIPALPR